MTAFNLLDEPWLRVRHRDGSVTEVTLPEALSRSHEFASLAGELPTQDAAVLRLLLAVVLRSFDAELRTEPVQTWRKLWEAPVLPAQHVGAYLRSRRDHFDLLTRERPFLQVGDLRTAKGTHSSLTALIADVPNNDPFFTTRLGRGLATLSFAEAARWLVHCHAFDPSGIKSGAVGDDRVKGGKGYPIGVGWAGCLGLVLIEGRTLRETLLLNLVPQRHNGDPLSPEDSAVWERDPLTAAALGRTVARGPADTYTWPSRRIRLIHDDSAVTGVIIANGDPLAQQNQFAETMTSWRRSEPQEKKLGLPLVYMPRAHDPERAFWRGLGPLLARNTATGTPSQQGPLAFEWLTRMINEGILSRAVTFRVRAVGMAYGSNNSVVAEIIDDTLALPGALLTESGGRLRAAALASAEAADDAALAAANLAGDLAGAAGGDPVGPRQEARARLLFALDSPFRRWLSAIGPETDPMAARTEWERTALDLARTAGREIVSGATQSAWTGREIDGRLTNTPVADLKFRVALRKALPRAHEEPPPAGSPGGREEVA